jgi:hypothetical protein
MNNDKCIFRENIFVKFTFSIDMFDIFKTIIATTRIIFQAINCRLLHQNYLFEDNTNDLRKKIILKSDQKIVQSNSFHKNEYNYFNKIQKGIYTTFAFKANTTKRRANCLKEIIIIELN